MAPRATSASALPPRGTGTSRPTAGRARPRRVSRVLLLAALVGLLAVGTALGALLVRQDVATTTGAVAPDIRFLPGTDYAAIQSLGFGALDIGASQTSATLTINGVPGAAWLSLANLLRLENTDPTNAYDITMTASALHPAITSFQVTVKDGATTLATWDAAGAAPAFTLAPSTTLDVSVTLTIADGTAIGALGAFDWHFNAQAV